MQASPLRSNRAGFYAFLALAMVAIIFAIYMLFTGPGDTNSQSVQTAADLSDVTVAPVEALPVVMVDAASATFEASSFTESTPVPTPEPTPEPTPAPVTETSTEPAATDAAPAETASSGEAGTPTLAAPTLGGDSTRAVSAAAAFTYVAFANGGGAQTIYDSAGGNPKQTTYQYLDGSVVNYPLTNPTYFGNPLALRVIGDASGEWAQVALPTRPNGQTGWINTADWSIQSSNWYVQINTNNNSVAVWRGEELMIESTAVTGKSSTPTPRVTGFVDEKMPGPSGAYGPWLLSLGVFSNAHNTFGGGIPKIALHGNNDMSLMGQYASNGCIRVPNDVITWIYNNVPVGTYVAII